MAKRIFISYGTKDGYHAAEWLVGELKQRGYDAWWDKERLKASVGASWELEIEKEIKASHAVIALLSPHAVRPDGECRHEISLARSHNRLIVPVVVKPCERPLRLHALQYVDLKGFEFLSPQDKRGRLHQILDFIERGVPEDLSVAALKRKFQRIDLDGFFARHSNFIGRKWLMDRFDEWLHQRSEPVMLLVGPPGHGKSAALAHWTQTRLGIGAVHFCRHNRPELRDPRRFVISVAAQMLASNLPGYSQKLEALVADLEHGSKPAALELMHRLVLDPLQELAGAQSWVLVFDALDEAGEDMLRLFRDVLNDMPRQVRFLMSARPEPEVLRLFPKSCRLDLEASACDRDVQAYLTTRISDARFKSPLENANLTVESATKVLLGASAGSHLVAQMLVDEFAATGSIGLGDHGEGLGQFYEEYLERKFRTADEFDAVRPLLEVLAACYEPVSDEFVGLILDMPTRAVREGFQKLGSLVPLDVKADKRAAFHRSFHEWLIAEREAMSPFSIDRSEGQRRIALKLGTWLSKSDPMEQPLTGGESGDTEEYIKDVQEGRFSKVRYAFRYFLQHMCEAGNYQGLSAALLNKDSISQTWSPFWADGDNDDCPQSTPDSWESYVFALNLDTFKSKSIIWDRWEKSDKFSKGTFSQCIKLLQRTALLNCATLYSPPWLPEKGRNAFVELVAEAAIDLSRHESVDLAKLLIKSQFDKGCLRLDERQIAIVMDLCKCTGLDSEWRVLDFELACRRWKQGSISAYSVFKSRPWALEKVFLASLKDDHWLDMLLGLVGDPDGMAILLAHVDSLANQALHVMDCRQARSEMFKDPGSSAYQAYDFMVALLALGSKLKVDLWRSAYEDRMQKFAQEHPHISFLRRVATQGGEWGHCYSVMLRLGQGQVLGALEAWREHYEKFWPDYVRTWSGCAQTLSKARTMMYARLALAEEENDSASIQSWQQERDWLDRQLLQVDRSSFGWRAFLEWADQVLLSDLNQEEAGLLRDCVQSRLSAALEDLSDPDIERLLLACGRLGMKKEMDRLDFALKRRLWRTGQVVAESVFAQHPWALGEVLEEVIHSVDEAPMLAQFAESDAGRDVVGRLVQLVASQDLGVLSFAGARSAAFSGVAMSAYRAFDRISKLIKIGEPIVSSVLLRDLCAASAEFAQRHPYLVEFHRACLGGGEVGHIFSVHLRLLQGRISESLDAWNDLYGKFWPEYASAWDRSHRVLLMARIMLVARLALAEEENDCSEVAARMSDLRGIDEKILSLRPAD